MTVAARLTEEDVQAGLAALRSGWLTMGPRIQALESEFAARMDVAHAIAVSSGAAGLQLACLAAGVRDGTTVVASAFAPAATVAAVRNARARPLAADVGDAAEPSSTVEAAVEAADRDTVAVIASHLGGSPSDVAALRSTCWQHGWTLVEDATEALGAQVPGGRPAGTVGHLGVYDFAPGRVVGVGEGGMVVTDDDRLAQRIRHLRSHAMTSVTWDRHRGHAESYDIVAFGFNFRMDEPRAALAASRLSRLDELVERRRATAAAVRQAAGLPSAVAGAAPQAVGLPLRDQARRDAVAAGLTRLGVPVDAWPDAWGEAPVPPGAADARARTVLIDLGAAESQIGDRGTLARRVGEAVRDV